MYHQNPGDPGSCIGAVLAKTKTKVGLDKSMVSEAIINKQLTEQFPKMMEVVEGDTTQKEKLEAVLAYTKILNQLVKAIDGQD